MGRRRASANRDPSGAALAISTFRPSPTTLSVSLIRYLVPGDLACSGELAVIGSLNPATAPRLSRSHHDAVTTTASTAHQTSIFAAAAQCFSELVSQIPPGAWDGPGLGEWDLRSLVGHTSRSLSTVITYLQQPAPTVRVPTAVAYYVWVTQQLGADPAAVAERGRQAGRALGDNPAAVIPDMVRHAVTMLEATDGDPVIETIAGGMQVSEYLPTRTFELTVHTLDIAAALDVAVTPPVEALANAVQLAAAVAVERGDGASLLLALTGRSELPTGYSMV